MQCPDVELALLIHIAILTAQGFLFNSSPCIDQDANLSDCQPVSPLMCVGH